VLLNYLINNLAFGPFKLLNSFVIEFGVQIHKSIQIKLHLFCILSLFILNITKSMYIK